MSELLKEFSVGTESVKIESRILFILRYKPIFSIDNGLDSNFLSLSDSQFNKPQEVKGIRFNVPTATLTEAKTTAVHQWILLPKDKKFKAMIDADSLEIKSNELISLTSFLTSVSPLITNFRQVYKDIQFTSIALRHIHIITINSGDPRMWNGYINDSILTPIPTDFPEYANLAKIITQHVYNKEDFLVVFNYGMPNPEFPAKIARRQFVLDIECRAKDVSPDMNEQITTFNNYILALFRQCTVGELKKQIGTLHE
jgi:uncharacterized protein (TIGR04255 family)